MEVVAFDQERGPWEGDDAAFTEALKNFVCRHDFAKDAVYTVLPRHDVTSRILTLPSQNPVEIESMVRLSAEEFVPYLVEELVIDQCILQRLTSGESRVLAVLVHQDVLHAHLSILRKASLEPQQVFLSSSSLASAGAAIAGGKNERLALLNLGSSGLEVVVLENGDLQYTRGIAAVHDWTLTGEKAAAIHEELAVELRSSLAAYRRETEDGLGVEKIAICSDWADVTDISEVMTRETGKECRPMQLTTALLSKSTEHFGSVVPMTAIGAALAAQNRSAVKIELLPPAEKRLRKMIATRMLILRVAAVFALAFIALCTLYGQAVVNRKALISELQHQTTAIESSALDIASKREKLQILGRQVERKGTVLELLATTSEAAPRSNLNITQFSYDRDRGIDIWGRAKTADDVFRFNDALRELAVEHLSLFATAKSAYEDRSIERNRTIYLYQIQIPKPEDENAT